MAPCYFSAIFLAGVIGLANVASASLAVCPTADNETAECRLKGVAKDQVLLQFANLHQSNSRASWGKLGDMITSEIANQRRRISTPTPMTSLTREDFDLSVINRIMSYGDMFQDEPPTCWVKLRNESFDSKVLGMMNMGEDRVAIYRTDLASCPDRVDTCVLSIGGSNDNADTISNINLFANGEFCGMNNMHAGVADEAKSMLQQADKWIPFVETLAKCPRIIFSGHSLGGSIVTALATCVNCNNLPNCSKPAELDGIRQEVELYTLAAFAILPDPPQNGMQADGVFKGKRLWSYESTTNPWTADMIPQVMKIGGFRHPKIHTIGLDGASQNAKMEEGDGEDAPDEPRGIWMPEGNRLHHMDTYVGAVVGHMPANPLTQDRERPVCKFGEPFYFISHRNGQISDSYGVVGLSENRDDWEVWTLSEAGDGRVFITSHRGEQLQDWNGKATTSPNKDDWERWSIIDAGDGKVFIQSYRNQQLKDYQGNLQISWQADEWEMWSLVTTGCDAVCQLPSYTPLPTTACPTPVPTPAPTPPPTPARLHCKLGVGVYFTSHLEHQLSDSYGHIRFSPNRDAWEKWTLLSAGDDRVFITSHRNHYLSDQGGWVSLAPAKKAWEKWSLVDGGDGKVFVTGRTGQNLQDYYGRLSISPNADAWEKWSITTEDGGFACSLTPLKEATTKVPTSSPTAPPTQVSAPISSPSQASTNTTVEPEPEPAMEPDSKSGNSDTTVAETITQEDFDGDDDEYDYGNDNDIDNTSSGSLMFSQVAN